MTARRKRWLIRGAVAAGVLVASLAGIRAALPGWMRKRIEQVAGDALGRKVTIGGAFELSMSLTPTLLAEDINLANVSWGSEPSMVRVARASVTLDLRSLFGPTVRVKDLKVDGVRILLESGADGLVNWKFDRPEPKRLPKTSSAHPVVFDHASIRKLELVVSARERPPIQFGITRADARLEETTGMVELDAAGHFNEAPWDVSGTLGTIDRLYALHDVAQAVAGHLGSARVSVQGRIRDPLALGDPNLVIELDGPDVVAALATVGLKSTLTGPFTLRAQITPAAAGADVDITAGLDGVTAKVRGHVGELLRFDAIGATVEASGPDASVVGRWTGVSGLPPGPFEVAGRVRRDGPKVSFDGVKVRVGGTSLTVSGPLGPPPRCAGTDLAVAGKGRDLAQLSALTRVRLPSGPFTVRGRFLRREDALAIEDVDIRLGETHVRGGGTIGEPPRLQNLDLTADVSGPDLSLFSGIATIALPHEPFDVGGRVAHHDSAWELHDIVGHVGGNAVAVHGRILPVPRIVGSDLQGHVAGPDLAAALALLGGHGVPGQPYDVSGQLGFASDGYDLEAIEARVGRISVSGRGRLGVHPAEDGTAVDFRAQGPSLDDLAAWGVKAALPEDPFEVSGGLRVASRVVHLEGVVAMLGRDRIKADGALGALPDTSALDLAASVAGPRLRELARFFGRQGDELTNRIPSDPYTASGRIRHAASGIELQGGEATVGDTELAVAGILGSGPGLRGTNVTFEARAPDTMMAEAVSGIALPAGPVELRGRLERLDAGFRVEGGTLTLGPAHATVSGTIGEGPAYADTAIDVAVEGPDLSELLDPVNSLSSIPAESFAASAHLEGSASRFASDRFTARLGANDLDGRIALDLTGKPSVEADLHSNHLGVAQLAEEFGEATAETPALAKRRTRAERKRDRLVPDEPLSLEALRSFDLRLRLIADTIDLPAVPLRDAVLEGEIRDGALKVTRAEGTGINGGRSSASLSLTPVEDGFKLQAAGSLAGGRLDFSKGGGAAEGAPSLDINFELEGTGRSLHAIAASSDGSALITLGPGQVPNTVGSFWTSDFLVGLMNALNPLRKSSPNTAVECGVIAAGLDGGKVVVAPIAARTDKLTVTGRGKIDFATEGIDLVWTIKPRKGVGISAASIANPFIKLGGTLAHPKLDAKPLEAATSTGAAVVTGGLTLLFRNIYNRITAEKKVCVNALAKAQRQNEAREAKKASQAAP